MVPVLLIVPSLVKTEDLSSPVRALFNRSRGCQTRFQIFNHRCKGNAVHRSGNGVLDLAVRLLQHAPDILCHWTGPTIAGVDANKGGEPVWFQSSVDIVQGDQRRIFAKFRTALTSMYRNQSCLFQGAERVTDYDGIAPGALSQQRTGDTNFVSGLPDKEQTVHRYGTFHTDLHDKTLSYK